MSVTLILFVLFSTTSKRPLFFFFCQAEDGIRAFHVTGVQTCALPIYPPRRRVAEVRGDHRDHVGRPVGRAPRRILRGRLRPPGAGREREPGACLPEGRRERRIMTTPDVLAALAEAIRSAPVDELPRLAGILAEAQARLALRLAAPTFSGIGRPEEPERLLTLPEVAEIR